MTERYQIRVFTAWNRWARSSSTSTVRSAIPSRGWSMSLRSVGLGPCTVCKTPSGAVP